MMAVCVLWICLLISLVGGGLSQEMVFAQLGMSVNLTCSFPTSEIQNMHAPFWFINERAYELFSIARAFPFIPRVTSYGSLTIPQVGLDVNMTSFQCAAWNGNGLELGLRQLVSVDSSFERNVTPMLEVNELEINYQGLFIHKDRITLSWIVTGPCAESVEVEEYLLSSSGASMVSQDPVYRTTAVVGRPTFFTIESQNRSISYRLVARNAAKGICSGTQNIYYRYDADVIEMGSVGDTSATLCFTLPFPTCNSLNLVWPTGETGRSCVCPAYSDSNAFSSCAEGCGSTLVSPKLTDENSICISNFDNTSLNGSVFHFVCSTNPCGEDNCFLQSILASYIIIAETLVPSEATDPLLNTITAAMGGILVLLALLLTVAVFFYCCLKRNRHRLPKIYVTRIITDKNKAYDVSKVSISGPQGATESPESGVNGNEVSALLYEQIPGDDDDAPATSKLDEQNGPQYQAIPAEQVYQDIKETCNSEDFKNTQRDGDNTTGASDFKHIYEAAPESNQSTTGGAGTKRDVYSSLNHNRSSTLVQVPQHIESVHTDEYSLTTPSGYQGRRSRCISFKASADVYDTTERNHNSIVLVSTANAKEDSYSNLSRDRNSKITAMHKQNKANCAGEYSVTDLSECQSRRSRCVSFKVSTDAYDPTDQDYDIIDALDHNSPSHSKSVPGMTYSTLEGTSSSNTPVSQDFLAYDAGAFLQEGTIPVYSAVEELQKVHHARSTVKEENGAVTASEIVQISDSKDLKTRHTSAGQIISDARSDRYSSLIHDRSSKFVIQGNGEYSVTTPSGYQGRRSRCVSFKTPTNTDAHDPTDQDYDTIDSGDQNTAPQRRSLPLAMIYDTIEPSLPSGIQPADKSIASQKDSSLTSQEMGNTLQVYSTVDKSQKKHSSAEVMNEFQDVDCEHGKKTASPATEEEASQF